MARLGRWSVCLTFVLVLVAPFWAGELPPLPQTPKKPVVDVYHGVKVTDDYRWLENAADPTVLKWTEAQNQLARAVLDQCPFLPDLRERLGNLMRMQPAGCYGLQVRGGRIFALLAERPREQPFLVVFEDLTKRDDAQVVVDPNTLNSKGKTAIDFYVPSHEGKFVAVSLSENGSEEGTLHVFETATGKELPDVIPRVQCATAGGDVAWSADGSGFYYTRYPHETERAKEDLNFYQQLYFHKMGDAASKDAYVLGKDLPRIAEISLDTSEDGKYLLVTVQNGDGGEFEHYLLGPSGKWTQLTHFADQYATAAFDPGQPGLYLMARKGAPLGQIVRVALPDADLTRATTVVPVREMAIDGLHFAPNGKAVAGFVPTASGLYVAYVNGGPSEMRFVPRDGGKGIPVPLPSISSVDEMVCLKGDELLFRNETFITAPAWYVFTLAKDEIRRTALIPPSDADFPDTEVVREFAVSNDGTRVPLNILRRKGISLDGSHPTLLTGYGGFAISIPPGFSVDRRLWLEQGGVLAIANLRGGSEYGEDWHKAGNLTHKQNVFDDFAACARHLIERKYTNPEKLAIEGGSNGGLLMGAALTQHPELFRAVVAHVGLYDMLRFEQHPNGAFNVTEYGSVKDEEQFKALYGYSPYQHVKDGVAYPAVFLLTGANDGRVDPANSRKMAARLQAATSKRPVILLTSFDSGHGHGDNLSAALDRTADVYAFLFEQLGMKYKPVR
jgi:prolyl oligopeptidase